MKRGFIIFSLSLFATPVMQAQQESPVFGKVDMAELQMKECAFEKDAAAMFLLNEVTAEIIVDNYSGDVKIKYESHIRIKIFNEKGYGSASIVIPYFGNNSTSKITDISAAIYNLDDNGKMTVYQLKKDDIFKDKGGGKKGVNSVRFTFPGLKPGSVIEYSYTKIRKNSSHLEPWYFQDEIPAQVSSCTVIAPHGSDIHVHFVTLQNAQEDSLTEAKAADKMMLRKYTMYNVPSFRIESLMSSVKDNLQRAEFLVIPQGRSFFSIHFDPSALWPLFNAELLSAPFFGGQFNKVIEGTQNTVDSINKLHNDGEKINAVYEYVKKNVQWDKEQTFYADDINDVWKNKTGNSAEINLIILNLLRKAGVYSYPLLISTRENGSLDMGFPNMGQFNGVDVLVSDSNSNYVLDGVLQYQSYKIPPFNILNRKGLVIDNDESRWVTIGDIRQLMNTTVSAKGDVDSNGVLHGEAVITFKDYARAEKIKEEKSPEESNQEKEKDFLQGEQVDFKIDTLKKENENDILKPLLYKIKFHYTLSNTGDIYFINPFFFSMFRKNPFTDSVRHTDIDFGCRQYNAASIYITVPKNFSVEDIPKSETILTEDSSILFSHEVFNTEDGVIIRNEFEMNQPVFTKEKYLSLRSFFEKLYALSSQQIVLKKKE